MASLAPSLPVAASLTPVAGTGRWRPGLGGEGEGGHAELFADAVEASGMALALAFAQDRLMATGAQSTRADPLAPALADWPDRRAWLWVQDSAALRLGGRPYRHGLPATLRHRLIHVCAKKPEDALFALEEGLRCRDLAFVVGEIAGNPKALDMTASRRLSLTAERHGIPLWLVRLDGARDLSSARLRWHARSQQSFPHLHDAHAPGTPRWMGELFRARSFRPGHWSFAHDGANLAADPIAPPSPAAGSQDPGDLAAGDGDRSVAALAPSG